MTAEAWAQADTDLFADEVLLDPCPYYGALREQAAAVYVKKTDVWAVTRYAEIRAALAKPQVFSSGTVAFNDMMNQALVALGALARRVRSFAVSDGQRRISNTTHGYATLPVVDIQPA